MGELQGQSRRSEIAFFTGVEMSVVKSEKSNVA
jgi:hypothetical protein